MKIPVYDLDGNKTENIDLPEFFSMPYRSKLIHRAVIAINSHQFSPQGRDPLAGERTSSESWNTGRGVSRIARVRGRGAGARSGQAAGVASVVKGRLPHPPRSEKVVKKRLNKKERRLALISSIAASIDRDVVSARGHKIDGVKSLPLIVTDEIEGLSRARDLKHTLNSLGLEKEMERISVVKKPSGKARLRGRTARTKKGPLIVISQDSGVSKAANNLVGIDCVLAPDLSAIHMAPGSHMGRLTIWSKSALTSLPDPVYGMVNLIAT